MALIKTPQEIKILQEGGKILSQILALLTTCVKPGISTWDLEMLARKEIKKAGAEAAFAGYRASRRALPFPAALCTSIDAEIVHCVPKKDRFLAEGQIIGLDLGIKYKGLFTDAAVTVPVGKISRECKKLLAVTRKALAAGIREAKPGKTIGDIAFAIEATAQAAGLGIVRDLAGHGVGHAVHEEPSVPNFGKKGTLAKLRVGMVLAIEPMLTLGSHQIRILDDGWTVMTEDGSLAAHFEHTVAITAHGALVLTA